ncbi:tripartite tricarboxylate transporter TctB family protein [Sinobaca sp. H24]|uniref:tripartite tricarboxylate transporter TctB family protein n=1 Tax=Sinobaca sp. H24 TaxID=2923376 RepID=UPI00207A85A8|nr:tripartite tricarboxylate transporter TctB family protein [Sinobaca sp. H24]
MILTKSYTADIVISSIMILLSLWFLINSMGLPLSLGGGDVGAAAFPLFASSLCLIFSISLLVIGINQYKKKNEDIIRFDNPMRILSAVGAFGMYAFLMPLIGYYISTIIFMPILLIIAQEKKWLKITLVTLGFLLFSWAAFDIALGVPLP